MDAFQTICNQNRPTVAWQNPRVHQCINAQNARKKCHPVPLSGTSIPPFQDAVFTTEVVYQEAFSSPLTLILGIRRTLWHRSAKVPHSRPLIVHHPGTIWQCLELDDVSRFAIPRNQVTEVAQTY